MAPVTSLAPESPPLAASARICVGHTHRHDAAVTWAGKLFPQMSTRSLPRSSRSLLPGRAPDASPERHLLAPAQLPPSRRHQLAASPLSWEEKAPGQVAGPQAPATGPEHRRSPVATGTDPPGH